MRHRILFSNIGYARGIDGSLRQHVARFGRHFYCAPPVQERVLAELRAIIDAEKPDLCCFVEIDSGSLHTANLNQMEALAGDAYPFRDIASKYAQGSWLAGVWPHKGKSNGFMAREQLGFERLYFSRGGKRLVYRMALSRAVTVYFAHFSLSRDIRARQMRELRGMVLREEGDVAVLADFNIFGGTAELAPLLEDGRLILMNDADRPTFTFYETVHALDLCLCTPALAARSRLDIIPQPFSDHDALLLAVDA